MGIEPLTLGMQGQHSVHSAMGDSNFFVISQKKNTWEHFAICLLDKTLILAQFGCIWAGLAVLFIKQIINGSTILFCFLQTVETHALGFFSLLFFTQNVDNILGNTNMHFLQLQRK